MCRGRSAGLRDNENKVMMKNSDNYSRWRPINCIQNFDGRLRSMDEYKS